MERRGRGEGEWRERGGEGPPIMFASIRKVLFTVQVPCKAILEMQTKLIGGEQKWERGEGRGERGEGRGERGEGERGEGRGESRGRGVITRDSRRGIEDSGGRPLLALLDTFSSTKNNITVQRVHILHVLERLYLSKIY